MFKWLKRLARRLNILPSDSKSNDFHVALADYLYKELKTAEIPVEKNNVCLTIKLNSYLDKYDKVVIDCHAGKMYLRGSTDRYWGKLRRFNNGKKVADAYHCAAQSATRIINRIKRILESAQINIVASKNTNLVDKRTFKNTKEDLNKTAKLVDKRKFKQVNLTDSRFITSIINNKKVVASLVDKRSKQIFIIDKRK